MDTEQICLNLGPISPSGAGPLYGQISAALRREIACGRVPPGVMLPSVRALAEGLLVSVITVKRAYDELEREGLLATRQGLGTFVVADSARRSRAQAEAEARSALAAAVAAARVAGLTEADLAGWLKELFRSSGEG